LILLVELNRKERQILKLAFLWSYYYYSKHNEKKEHKRLLKILRRGTKKQRMRETRRSIIFKTVDHVFFVIP
jgi:hypothetical protein